jgi:DNA repair protein RadA/Sms
MVTQIAAGCYGAGRIEGLLVARNQTVCVCGSCGGEALKWQGQCPHCGQWNTLSRLSVPGGTTRLKQSPTPAVTSSATAGLGAVAARLSLQIGELDRVFGGGLAAGSVSLLGGEPGIGKSTLLLQLAAAVAAQGAVLYASGEESVAQVAARAQRLSLSADGLGLLSDNQLDGILAQAAERRVLMLVIDSIQTMQIDTAEGSAGSPQQLRECTAALVRFAKSSSITVLIVGHVTKDGSIAGPKLLEHLVDTVLYFESEAGSRYRLLRATKNRFGPVNETGFFAMTETGLKEVRNPAAIFLSRNQTPAPGSVVMVARDGSRPLLVEVQALVDRSKFAAPRRVAQGVDSNRLSMLLAVMSRHADLPLADYDVFVNIVGGLQIAETATDLPLVLALASSLRGRALPSALVAFGEIGLTGEVRPVAHGEERLRELQKQGFGRVILPRDNAPRAGMEGVQLQAVATVSEALAAV